MITNFYHNNIFILKDIFLEIVNNFIPSKDIILILNFLKIEYLILN
jgi:hypothetical protein